MEKEALLAQYRAIARTLRCPRCGKRGRIAAFGGFLCEKMHTFDLSGKGYINFVPQLSQQKQKYDKALFESRRRLLSAGFYQPLSDALLEEIQAHPVSEAPLLLDVGCGEGHYAAELRQSLSSPWQVIGTDINRSAIRLAAAQETPVCWLVADLKHLPLASQSVDILLNILTPADYQEYARVLKRDGLLLKVSPGPHYLQEIRALLGLPAQPEEQTQVADHFAKHMRLLKHRHIQATQPVTPAQAQDFLRMTPLAFDRELPEVSPAALTHITLDLELLVGTRKR